MTEIVIVFSIIVLIINVITWIVFGMSKKRQRCLGTLIINMSDPNKDIYRIALEDLHDVETHKKIYLKVKIEDDTQK